MNPCIDHYFENYYKDNPFTLVDIGAMKGANERWASFGKYLKVIGFEPDKRAFEELMEMKNDKKDHIVNNIYLNTALYNEKKAVKFYITKKEGNSSLLLPNFEVLSKFPDQDRYEVVDIKEIKVDLLDNQLKENGIQDVDFIKIDTQGSELFILQGAIDILRKSVFGLEIEVEFIELYKNQPLFSDVDDFLRKLGFRLFDLRKAYWKRSAGKSIKGGKGQVIFGDALYFKEEGPFFKNLEINKKEAKVKVLKAISSCIIFGYLDYSLVLLKEALDKNIIDSQESKIIKNNIDLFSKRNLIMPDFKGKWRIANLLHRLYKLFRQDLWAISDTEIGNIE